MFEPADDVVVRRAWHAVFGARYNMLYLDLLERYAENHRRYHTVVHLRHFFELEEQYVPPRYQITSFMLAALFHDVVYDTTRSDNEERSAELAAQWLPELDRTEDVEVVTQLVLATKRHEPLAGALHEMSCYFLDCDMAILGTAQEVYDQYARAIREEYSNYGDATYKAGRAHFLKKTLEKQSIFLTDEFRNAYEVQARANLQFELKLIGA